MRSAERTFACLVGRIFWLRDMSSSVFPRRSRGSPHYSPRHVDAHVAIARKNTQGNLKDSRLEKRMHQSMKPAPLQTSFELEAPATILAPPREKRDFWGRDEGVLRS